MRTFISTLGFFLSTFFAPVAFSQGFECTTELTEAQFRAAVSDVDNILSYSRTENNDTIFIPLYFTVIRRDDGTTPGYGIDFEELVDSITSTLNQHFYPITNFYFVQYGAVNYLDNTYIYGGSLDWYGLKVWDSPVLSDFSYIPNGINVEIRPFGGTNGTPPFFAPPNNVLRLKFIDASNIYSTNERVATHEVGHIFGLLHTHGQPQLFKYNVESDSDYIDHPYYGTFPRELEIRDTTLSKTFPYPNCYSAADLCCDTPPDCYSGVHFYWPDSTCNVYPPYACPDGCQWQSGPSSVTYGDYNKGSISFLSGNYMSYRTNSPYSFSDEQIDRIIYYYDNYRIDQFDTSFDINWRAFVEFENTDNGMQNIVIRPRHDLDTTLFCNSTTDSSGVFQSILFDTLLTADVFKLGSGDSLKYTHDDWTLGVTTQDMVFIQRHILKIDTLNGYHQLAADVNNTGTITTADLVEIKKLILGIFEKFPSQNKPWQFFPEYIPETYEISFHADPFNMEIGGESYQNEAPYLDSDWKYVIVNGTSGEHGYDAIKMGDVNGTSDPEFAEDENCMDEATISYTDGTTLDSVKLHEFDFILKDSTPLAGLQLRFKLDFDLLEYEGSNDGSLFGLTVEDGVNIDTNNNLVTVVWYNSSGTTTDFSPGKSLFKIELENLDTLSNLDEIIKLDDGFYNALIDSSGCLTNGNIEIEFTQLDSRSVNPSATGGNKESFEDHIYVWPNPFEGSLVIEFMNNKIEGPVEITLVNSLGQKVLTKEVHLDLGRQDIILKISDKTTSGHYLLHIQQGNDSWVKKMIKS